MSSKQGPAAGASAFERIVDRLAVTGFPPRHQADGSYMARCPAHADREPSLHVTQGPSGVLLHCHAGCATDAVVAALDLPMSALYDAPIERPADSAGRGSWATVATYSYGDETGVELFQVLRYDNPKRFRQRRRDPSGAGPWIYKLEGTRRVLYRLAEVIAAVAAGPRAGARRL